MNNKYIQAVIIAAVANFSNLIPTGGSCVSFILALGLFFYFSKLQSAENPDYAIKDGVLFGLTYAVIATVFTYVFTLLFAEILKDQAIAMLDMFGGFGGEEVANAMEDEKDAILDQSASELANSGIVMSLVSNAVVNSILGLIAGLIFRKKDENQ